MYSSSNFPRMPTSGPSSVPPSVFMISSRARALSKAAAPSCFHQRLYVLQDVFAPGVGVHPRTEGRGSMPDLDHEAVAHEYVTAVHLPVSTLET
jgi:hypothetical protein